MSTLYQQWQDLAYDETADRSQLEKFWGTYFQIEKEIYEKLLSNPDEVVKGTVKELAEKFGQEVLTMIGFLDGINESLLIEIDLDTVEEDTVVSLAFDKERLYKNMVAAKADWLYELPQWDKIFTEEKKGDYELTHWWIKDRKSFDYFTITGYYPTKDYIYLIGSKGDEIYTFCYNKEDKTVRKQVREGSITERKLPWFSQPFLHIDRPFVLKNDLLGGNFTVDYRSCGRYWVDVLEPGSDDNWIDVEQIKASTSCDEDKKQYFIRTLEVVDEDSNPILVIATLK